MSNVKRPFLKRGSGTTAKYNVNYPVLQRARKQPENEADSEQDGGLNPFDVTNSPERSEPQFSKIPALRFESTMSVVAEDGPRTDSGRGSNDGAIFSSPAFASDRQPDFRANDSGLSRSDVASPQIDIKRSVVLDPDATSCSEEASENVRPQSIVAEKPPSTLSSLSDARSERVRQVRHIARLLDHENENSSDRRSPASTLNGISDLASQGRTISSISSGNSHAPTDSNFMARHFSTTYRPLDEVVPPDNQSVASSVANAKPSDATRKAPRFVDRSAQSERQVREMATSMDPSLHHSTSQPDARPLQELAQNANTTKNIYDTPLQFQDRPQSRAQRGIRTSRLVEQLRDAILNLDFAEAEWRRRCRAREEELTAEWEALRLAKEEFEEWRNSEEARLQKLKADSTRLSKAQQKGSDAKEQEREQQLADAKEQNSKLYAQLIDVRNKLRTAENEAKKQQNALEKETVRAERALGRIEQMQKELATCRNRVALEKGRLEREEAASRRCAPWLQANRRRPSSTSDTPDSGIDGSTSTICQDTQTTAQQQQQSSALRKSVRWADDDSDKPKRMAKISGSAGEFGQTDVFMDGAGRWTKITTTPCGATFYEHDDGDVQWMLSGISLYYYAGCGSTQLTFPCGLVIRHFLTRQLDIFRVTDQITSLSGDGRMVEMRRNANGFFEAIKTEANGEMVKERGAVVERLHGVKRNPGDPISLFLDEVDCGIYFQNGDVKLTLAALNIQIQLVSSTDDGIIKHVVHKGAQKLKDVCVQWGAARRRKQRAQAIAKMQSTTSK